MKRWYLMRHGQTDYNRRRCFYGSHDVSINEQGQEDARQLELLMQERTVDAIYTSCLKRTQETAQLAFPERQVQPIADFDERGFGHTCVLHHLAGFCNTVLSHFPVAGHLHPADTVQRQHEAGDADGRDRRQLPVSSVWQLRVGTL